jgi:Tfp pilus assembly protein PilN
MRAVNLLPEERRGDQTGGSRFPDTKWVLIAGASLLAVAFVFVSVSFIGARSKVSDKRSALHALQLEVAQAQARVRSRPTAATAPSARDTQARLAAFDAASAARISWDTLLADVARVLPAGAWLSNLSLHGGTTATDATGAPAPSTGTGFTVSGFALSHDVVAEVMQRLALVPMLTDVTLQSSQRSDLGTHKAYAFTMSASVRVNGER